MEDWVALFKSSPLAAIGMVVFGGGYWLIKNKQEKTEDSKEVVRITTALNAVIKERDDANDRADAAFAKQLELTERFSEMRAQHERMSVQMEQVSKQLSNMAEDNLALHDQVKELTEQNRALSQQVERLQSSIDSGITQ